MMQNISRNEFRMNILPHLCTLNLAIMPDVLNNAPYNRTRTTTTTKKYYTVQEQGTFILEVSPTANLLRGEKKLRTFVMLCVVHHSRSIL